VAHVVDVAVVAVVVVAAACVICRRARTLAIPSRAPSQGPVISLMRATIRLTRHRLLISRRRVRDRASHQPPSNCLSRRKTPGASAGRGSAPRSLLRHPLLQRLLRSRTRPTPLLRQQRRPRR